MELRDTLQTALSLSGASDGEIASHIGGMQSRLTAFENADTLRLTERSSALVADAVKARKITQSQSDAYLSLAGKDYDSTKQILDSLPAVLELGDKESLESPKVNPWVKREDEINANSKK